MKETISDIAHGWLVMVIAGLGLSLTLSEFIGGVLLAFAGAFIARGDKGGNQRSVLITMMSAFFVAVIAVELVEHLGWSVSPPLVMALAGFGSRFAVVIALRAFGQVEGDADQLVKRLIDRFLPTKKP